MSLLDAPHSRWLKVSALEGGSRFRTRFSQYGLFIGDRLRVLRSAPLNGPLLVELNGREIAFGRGVAGKIIVEVIE